MTYGCGMTETTAAATLNTEERFRFGTVGPALPGSGTMSNAWSAASAPAYTSPNPNYDEKHYVEAFSPLLTAAGGTAGASIAAHPGIGKIAFTGETTTGRLIMQYASENIIPVTLELGGKSPNIVFADADLEQAAKGYGDHHNGGSVTNRYTRGANQSARLTGSPPRYRRMACTSAKTAPPMISIS